MTRFSLKAIILLLVLVVPLGSVMAQAVKKEEAKQADFLFVQTAKGMTFDKSTNS